MPRWRRDGGELYFLSLDGTMIVAPLNPAGGLASDPQPLFATTSLPVHNRTHAVTRDGQRFLIPRLLPDPPITVTLNWPVMLQDGGRAEARRPAAP